MYSKILRILIFGFVVVFLFATFPGQATGAQQAKSTIRKDQRVDRQSVVDMIKQTTYLAQSAPLLSESVNKPAVAQTALTAAERSLVAETDDDTEMDWIQHLTADPPFRPLWPGMAYDSARGVTVLFGGGIGPNTQYNDTWEWDGTSWTERTTLNKPTAR